LKKLMEYLNNESGHAYAYGGTSIVVIVLVVLLILLIL
jgi:hypothetical protein